MEIRDRIKEFRRVKAKDLVPHELNWRVHTGEQSAALKGLLAEVGFAGALLVRPISGGKFQILDGHLRAKTLKSMEVPVVVCDLNDEEANKLLLTYDPIASLAEADSDRIRRLLETVHTDSQAVGALLERVAGGEAWQAAAPGELLDPEPRIDEAAEISAKWGTQPGQAWQIGPHRLLCGDCRDRATVGRLWAAGGQKLRLVWTDPPYGVDYAAKNAYLNRSDRGNRIQVPIENDNLTAGETGILFKKALEVAKHFAEPGAACCTSVPGGPLLVYFIQAFQASGFEFKHQLVWLKQQFVISMGDYHHRFEPILYGWLPNGAHYFVDDRTLDDVFEVDKPHVSDLHPTTKPVELIARMISNSSRSGELIYDPFCGSGSTLLAAHQLGRIGYGVEIDPRYVAVTLERLATLGLQPELLK